MACVSFAQTKCCSSLSPQVKQRIVGIGALVTGVALTVIACVLAASNMHFIAAGFAASLVPLSIVALLMHHQCGEKQKQ